MRALLVAVVLLAACRRSKSLIDLSCDQLVPPVEGRDWRHALRSGAPADVARASTARGQLIVRVFALADSTPMTTLLLAYTPVTPTSPSIGVRGTMPTGARLELPAGSHHVRVSTYGRASPLLPVDVVAGQTDTLDVYSAPWRTICDPP